jgi:hypothetical protein
MCTGFPARAMSGTELPRVRTEFRLRSRERINQSLLESRGPTLLCNQVPRTHSTCQFTALIGLPKLCYQ